MAVFNQLYEYISRILVLQQFVEDRKKNLEEKKCNGQNDDTEPPAKQSRKFGIRDVSLNLYLRKDYKDYNCL